jgi:ubiquinone/menaquinone biosynthesis C-methylase UbiE
MDAARLQKVAIVSAYTLGKGNIADMGSGSGSNSFDLASLYPNINVIGIDVNSTMVERALEKYKRSNLQFILGDIAQLCLPKKSQDAIIDSSVLHHVTSFSHPPYDYNAAGKAIEVQSEMLKDHGVLVIRDFVDPGHDKVLLDLPDDPGSGKNYQQCSVNDLFHAFTKQFRSLSSNPGCEFKEHPAPSGKRRYELSHKLAAEFILRKDYRESWELEIQEEYTYFTMEQFKEIFKKLDLRLLSATPLRNPWIVANRFKGKFELRSLDGHEIDYPPTNCLIVGEKVPENEGVEIKETQKVKPLDYLQIAHYKRKDTGYIYDLVRRPGVTLDIIPYFFQNEQMYVLSRRSYPRPIVTCHPRGTSLIDGSSPIGYMTEPLNVQLRDKSTIEAAEELLYGYGGLEIMRIDQGLRYFPSPGGIQEEINSLLIEVKPIELRRSLEDLSGFSTSGVLQTINANHLLQAAQVGAMPDARLENNIYTIFLKMGLSLGPWIAEKIALKDGKALSICSVDSMTHRSPRSLYEKTQESSEFLELCSSEFLEFGANNTPLRSQNLEFVIPKNYSYNTVAVALLRRYQGEIYIGIDDDDLPAVQYFEGHSNMFVAPAWRLPRNITGMKKTQSWVLERLKFEYGVSCQNVWELGGRYHSSAGVTPEVVFPFAIEVEQESPQNNKILWMPLKEVISHHNLFKDGHLRVVMFRAAHALGLI